MQQSIIYIFFYINLAFGCKKTQLKSIILEQKLRELLNSTFLFAEMGSGKAEHHTTFSLLMYSSLYSTVQLPSASLASVEVLLTHCEKQGKDRNPDR